MNFIKKRLAVEGINLNELIEKLTKLNKEVSEFRVGLLLNEEDENELNLNTAAELNDISTTITSRIETLKSDSANVTIASTIEFLEITQKNFESIKNDIEVINSFEDLEKKYMDLLEVTRKYLPRDDQLYNELRNNIADQHEVIEDTIDTITERNAYVDNDDFLDYLQIYQDLEEKAKSAMINAKKRKR